MAYNVGSRVMWPATGDECAGTVTDVMNGKDFSLYLVDWDDGLPSEWYAEEELRPESKGQEDMNVVKKKFHIHWYDERVKQLPDGRYLFLCRCGKDKSRRTPWPHLF